MAVNIAFVGSGNIAGRHMDTLEKIDEATVVGCMDVDEDQAAEAAARFPGAGAYTDLDSMLGEQDIDTAFVCVPPHAHGDIELSLIERGIAFYVEKPIGVDRETPRKILSALEEADTMAGVAYMCRYRETVQEARDLLQENQPVLARGGWIGGMPGVHWWRQKDMSGGQILEQTTHIFDMVRYLFGDVESVYCVGRTGIITDVENYDIEDASICTLTFENGMICELSSSCAVKCGGGVMLEVFGENLRLELSGWNLEVETPNETRRIPAQDDPFLTEDRAWLKAVETGDPSLIKSPYRDGFKTQMVTCAANESIESGEPVTP